jgi:hypothetical protein
MTLVVEDGTGKTNANTFADVATISAWWTDRGGSTVWDALTTPQKEAAAVKASDYLRNNRRFRWSGTKKTYLQRMSWPRIGATERDGPSIADNVLPWQVVEAACYLAPRAYAEDLQPDLAHGGRVTSERVDVIAVTYAADAPIGTILQVVDGLVATLLVTNDDQAFPDVSYYAPDPPAPYEPGAYSRNADDIA